MKLLLADDHTLFRDALVQYILRSNLDADVSVARDFTEVLSIMEADAAQDLIILDMRMPGMHGLEGFKTMREKYPDVPTALMSGVAEEDDVREAFENGARGYFPKTMSGKALLQAIRLVLMGERYMPLGAHSMDSMMPSYFGDGVNEKSAAAGQRASEGGNLNGESAEKVFKLTPREKEVLSYLVQGASNKEIANELGLQVVTVKLHVRGVCRKMDVKNRTQAALKATEYGVVSKMNQAGT